MPGRKITRPQKNAGQKNEDRPRFHRYFSASHFSASRGLAQHISSVVV